MNDVQSDTNNVESDTNNVESDTNNSQSDANNVQSGANDVQSDANDIQSDTNNGQMATGTKRKQTNEGGEAPKKTKLNEAKLQNEPCKVSPRIFAHMPLLMNQQKGRGRPPKARIPPNR